MKIYLYNRSETEILESLVDELVEHGITALDYIGKCKVLHLGNGNKHVVLPNVFMLQIDSDDDEVLLLKLIINYFNYLD